jgi:hypothetical protein
MEEFFNSLVNWLNYGKWVDCDHDWQPEGFADWKCPKCGAER